LRPVGPNPLDDGGRWLRILANQDLEQLGGTMADHHAMDIGTDADFAEHVKTYHLFLKLLKYGLIGVICVLIILAIVTL
jgi:hypothetical protein